LRGRANEKKSENAKSDSAILIRVHKSIIVNIAMKVLKLEMSTETRIQLRVRFGK